MPDEASIPQMLDAAEAAEGFSRAKISMVVTNPRLDDNPIVYVNDAFERMTGYARHAIIGQNCRFLQGEDTDPEQVKVIRDAVQTCEECAVDILNYRANGEPFRNRLIITPILGEDEECVYFFGVQKEMRDVENAREMASLDGQLSEIQHRVKNHLSMIIGMIRNQSRASTAPGDFSTLARRIESLQLLYEEMSSGDPGNRDEINLGAYLTRVSNAIAHIDGRAGIRCSIDIEPMVAPVDLATRLGLVLSEVLTNSFQHAFAGQESGMVDVRMNALSEGAMRLTIADDGIGMPEDLDWPGGETLGGRIVDGLIEGLGGTLHVGRGAAGTIVTIDVPVDASEFRQ